MLNASTITDEEILAEHNSELDVWSVGITLANGTYVGFGCTAEAEAEAEAEVPSAKAQVRARCTELLNTRSAS